MARPTKEYKVKRNNDSLQFFERGEYCGSLPIKALCQLAKASSGKGTALELAQADYINEGE